MVPVTTARVIRGTNPRLPVAVLVSFIPETTTAFRLSTVYVNLPRVSVLNEAVSPSIVSLLTSELNAG